MRIRPAQPDDRDEWLRMRQLLWPHCPLEEHLAEIADYFAGHIDGAVLVAEDAGCVAGFAEVSIRPFAEGCASDRVGYLEGWFVDEAHRRKGMGGALVRAAEKWAASEGCTEMASDTETHNTVSQHAHARLGYEEVERVVLFRKSLQTP